MTFGTVVLSDICRKRISHKEIHADMVATLGDNAPALSTLKEWAAEFKRGRESLEHDSSSGRPFTNTTQENIGCLHQIVTNDKRLTVKCTANVMSISHQQVKNIFHKELGRLNVSARYLPWLLTSDQKFAKLVKSEANLAIFKADPNSFVECFLIQDECWIHHFDPETK